MNPQTWPARPEIPAAVKTESLRRGLLWVFAIIQTAFLVSVIYTHVSAAVAENGDGLHDLGVIVDREMALSQIFDLWMVATIASLAVAAVIYYPLKARWAK